MNTNQPRATFMSSTLGILEEKNHILCLKFHQKWNQYWTLPGGKIEATESPLENIKREFLEETGLLINQFFLKALISWHQPSSQKQGFIFIYKANSYEKKEIKENQEGSLKWILKDNVSSLETFPMNKIFFQTVLSSKEYEEYSFKLDEQMNILQHKKLLVFK